MTPDYPDHADQDTHERVAQKTIRQNPELVRQALETGNYLPLIRAAMQSEVGLVRLWLAQRLGQLARATMGERA